nr:protein ALP1-like [Onthophagus taurus]XP_022908872.1 protein ALP1-like [Onthophagus taurus]
MLPKSVRLLWLLENPILFRKIILRKRKKRIGVHYLNRTRLTNGEFHQLYYDLRRDPSKFFEFLRMSIDTFDYILIRIKDRLRKKVTNFKRPISPVERLYLTLRFLSTGLSFRNLATTLRMGVCTVSKIVHETCEIIWNEFVDEFMPVPSQEQLQTVAEGYYRRWKFPNCVGSIDGKHCQIKCPPGSGSRYFNYLKYFSVVLQAVADADKKFITIEVGARGKQSDGGIFSSSQLFNLLENKVFNMPPDRELFGTNIKVPHVLIGDEAYPLKTYLMRPYPSRNLDPVKENFNNRLSIARKCIECAFGILRAKWRILGKDIEVSPEKAANIVKCTCILHNIVRHRDGNSDLHYCQEVVHYFPENQRETEWLPPPQEGHGGARRSSARAKQIRESFANYFVDF